MNELEFTSEIDDHSFWWTFKSPIVLYMEQDITIKMIRQEWHFKVGLYLEQAGREEGLWATEKLTDLEETYFHPFDLKIQESFDNHSKTAADKARLE